MNGKDAIQSSLRSTQQLVGWYLDDLSDADLLTRTSPTANHIAWQLGHLITSEIHLVKENIPDAQFPDLPGGFVKQHEKETSAIEPPTGFSAKEVYLNLFNSVREATLACVDKLSDADLDKPTQGTMAEFAPRLGDLLILVSNHTLMHGGQFTSVRRKLDKPVIF